MSYEVVIMLKGGNSFTVSAVDAASVKAIYAELTTAMTEATQTRNLTLVGRGEGIVDGMPGWWLDANMIACFYWQEHKPVVPDQETTLRCQLMERQLKCLDRQEKDTDEPWKGSDEDV